MALTDKQERGLMYGFREAVFALLEMHDKEVAALKAQLTHSQGRIAELQVRLRAANTEAAHLSAFIHSKGLLNEWVDYMDGIVKQQPTTLTKEGGGGTKGNPEGGEEEAEFIRQAAKRAFEEQR